MKHTMTRCRWTEKELIRWVKYANKSTGDKCWEWTGIRAKKRGGYGMFSFRGKNLRAHRVAYEHYRGAIPHGKWVLHSCDNPPCVNPQHLFLGDNGTNMRDAVAKGRHVPPRGEKCPFTTLTNADVINIRELRKTMSVRAIGKLYGIHNSNVSRIVNRKRWAHV